MTGVGLRASHNLIHDTPRIAIMFSGNNLVIEYNHMHHVNLETEDTGVVYTGGRDWISSRGTVIRYNYMHDSIGFGQENGKWVSPHFSWGVYLDDNTGGVDVIGNIVVRAYRGLLHLHNGRDNLIENNIFVGGKLQQAEFNGWTADQPLLAGSFPDHGEGLRHGEGPARLEEHAQHRDVARAGRIAGRPDHERQRISPQYRLFHGPRREALRHPQSAARPQPVGRKCLLAWRASWHRAGRKLGEIDLPVACQRTRPAFRRGRSADS